MTRLLAGGLFFVLAVEVLASVVTDRRLLLLFSGLAAVAVLLALRFDLAATRRSRVVDEAASGAEELLQRWKSQTEALIRWADSSRADWDRHLRPRLAREFLTATRQKDASAVQATGRMLFGDDLWQWVDPTNVSSTGRDEPGPGYVALGEILRRLEQL